MPSWPLQFRNGGRTTDNDAVKKPKVKPAQVLAIRIFNKKFTR
jgi:hypothetical protein